MIPHLGRLVSDYGYLIVALFLFLEGIAIPFPTDTTLVTAAAFAAHGRLSIVLLFLVSTVSASLGTTVAFLLGRRGGDFFERHAKKVNPTILVATRGFFDRHGNSAVVVGRFLPVARMLISPLAGLSSMSLARFTLFNVLGAALWSAVFCGLGYFFGQHPPALGRGLVRGALVVAVGLGILVTVAVAGGWLVEDSDAAWRAEGTIWHTILMTPPMRWLTARSPKAQAFLFRRFSAADYLGLNLTIGLGMSVVTLVIFSATMNALLTHDALHQFDINLAAALHDGATASHMAVWTTVSRLGALPLVTLAGALLAGWLAWRRASWLPVIGYVAAMGGSVILDEVVQRYFLHAAASSVANDAAILLAPSGQSLSALVGYGMIAYFVILLVDGHRLHVLIATSAFVLVAAISFGRLYIGARYFSDIVSGLAAGGVWLSACLTGLEVARRRQDFSVRRKRDRVDPSSPLSS